MARRERKGTTRVVAGPDEVELFRRTLDDVRPLKKGADKVAPPPPEIDIPEGMAVAAPRAKDAAKKQPARKKPPPPPLQVGATAGVDRRTADRLRRGRLKVEARLDLHGFTQAEAHSALVAFIKRSADNGKRCVLVVTGKGSVSRGGGVLRRRVPQWLDRPDCRPHIVSLAHARPEHGGEGALYVLLRRRRGDNTAS